MNSKRTVRRKIFNRRKYSAVFASTLYSQALAAANLGLVWTLGVASADSYTIGIQVSTFSYAGFVLGVVYLVALGRRNFNSFIGFRVAAGFLAVIAAILGSVPMISNPAKYGLADYLILAFFGLGGALLAIKAVSLVSRACAGEPHLLIRVTILPNVMLATGFLVLFMIPGSSSGASYLPALLWCAGTAFIFLRKYPKTSLSPNLGEEPSEHVELVTHKHLSQTFMLSTGVITSNVMPFVYIYALSGLEDGELAISFLLLRVVSSGVYLLAHTFLAANLNWKDGLQLDSLFEKWGLGFTLALSLLALMMGIKTAPPSTELVALSALGISLFFSTAYLREVNRARLQWVLVTKVLVDLVISICAALILVSNPSALGLFAATLISQCVTIAVCGFGLRKFFVSVTSLVVVIVAFGILVQ